MKKTAKSSDENKRREYLALLGIQPWYARVQLKNAGPSPVYPCELEVETAAAAKAAKTAKTAKTAKAAKAAKAVEAVEAVETVEAVEAIERVGAVEAAKAVEARTRRQTLDREPAGAPRPGSGPASENLPLPREFRSLDSGSPGRGLEPQRESVVLPRPLHYLRIDPALAVLAEDAWTGSDGAECRNLLANILQALGKTLDGASPGELACLNRRSAGAGPEQGALLEELCRRDRCQNMLIFAHDSSELFPRVSSFADFTRVIGEVRLRLTLTRGLREMLSYPDLKKYCWRDLQALRARLGPGSGSRTPEDATHRRGQ